MLTWVIENSILAGILGFGAWLASRKLVDRPAICHFFWVLVLGTLLAPPMPFTILPSVGIRAVVGESLQEILPPPVVEEEVVQAQPVVPLPVAETKEPAKPLWVVPKEDKPAQARAITRTESISPSEANRGGTGPVSERIPSPESHLPIIPAETGSRPFSVPVWWILGGIWAAGSLFVLLRHAVQILRFRTVLRQAEPASPVMQRALQAVAAKMQVTVPRMRLVPSVGSPFVWGFGTPTLVWPKEAAWNRTGPEEEAILAHELGHLRRRDHWVSWLELTGLILLWWNPLFYFVRRRIRHYAEMACDAWAVSVYPERKHSYARALIEVLERMTSSRITVPGLAAAHGERRNFEMRLQSILKIKMAPRISPHWAAAAVLLTVLVLPSFSRDTVAKFPAMLLAEKEIDHDLISPASLELLKKHAWRYYKSGDWKEAADTFRRVTLLEPKNANAFKSVGCALYEIEDYDGAMAAYRKAEELGFRKDKIRLYQAMVLAHAGKSSEALKTLEDAVALGACEFDDDEFPDLREETAYLKLENKAELLDDLWERGEDLMDHKKWDKAKEVFQEIRKIAPQSGPAHRRLAYVSIMARDLDLALEALNRQIELGEHLGIGHYNLACTHALLENREEALTHLEKAWEHGFDGMGNMLKKDSDLDNLRQEEGFQTLVSKVRKVDYAMKKIKLAAREGQPEEVMDLRERYGSSLKLAGEDQGWLEESLGRAHYEAGEYVRAIAAYKEQVKQGHDVSDALLQIGRSHALLGNNDEAFAYLRKSVETGECWGSSLAEDKRLASLREDERFPGLVEYAQHQNDLATLQAVSWEHLHAKAARKLEKHPGHARSYLNLGFAEFRLGNLENALEAFRKQEKHGYLKGAAIYNQACVLGAMSNLDEAFAQLHRAFKAGIRDRKLMLHDADLNPLRKDSRFEEFIQKWKDGKNHQDCQNECDHDHDHDHENTMR